LETSPAVLTGAPMYLGTFGLTEAPFSTTPDQRFLYLSDRHRDALAHLLYGVAERGGFMQLTGEVGTGKTTLCRYLLEHLPVHVDIALILNPTLSRLELLETICDELRIAYPAGSTSLKVLVDALHAHLLDAHARGRRTVVIVDEAQHLTVEVLEQLRLLTNLETGKAKLLQIILIGQPELLELMGRADLRQVAQRVAARYHLTPLTERETRAYVAHRLSMAGPSTVIFDDAALRVVHQESGGVPRLINVLCDRALLGAYATHSEAVTRNIVRRAAREIAGEVPGVPERRRRRAAIAAVAAGLVLATALVLVARSPLTSRMRMFQGASPTAPVAAAAVTPPATPAPTSRPSLRALLEEAAVSTDIDSAYAALAKRWGQRYERRPNQQPCEVVRRSGLDCIVRRGTWNVVRRFDLPAVLELVSTSGARRFLAVVSADDSRATVQFGSRAEPIPVDQLEREWDGSFVVLWKPPRVGMEALGPGVRGADVVWLRQQLGALDGHAVPALSSARTYDKSLASRVAGFQRTHELLADGIAGEETLAKLTAVLDPGRPSLRRARSGP
jgi:general secretion pathway protein A